MTTGCYVYLLRDPDVDDPAQGIFYVGKGTGLRAADHVEEAQRALERLTRATPEDAERADLSYKITRIQELHSEGRSPTVDVLAAADGSGLSSTEALAIEAALIAALRMTDLGNKVHGHRIRLMPESVFNIADKAQLVTMPADAAAVIAPVGGVWGGRDYAGTVLAADEGAIWDNARQLWSRLSPKKVAQIADLADSNQPSVLIALARHITPQRGNIVVGVFELESAFESDQLKGGNAKPDGTSVQDYRGWEFTRRTTHKERSSTTALRGQLLGNTLADPANVEIPLRRPQDRAYLGRFG